MYPLLRVKNNFLVHTALAFALALGVSACSLRNSTSEGAAADPATPATPASASSPATASAAPPAAPVEPDQPSVSSRVASMPMAVEAVKQSPPVGVANKPTAASAEPTLAPTERPALESSAASTSAITPASAVKPAAPTPVVEKAPTAPAGPVAPAAPTAFRVVGEIKLLDGKGQALSGDELVDLVVYFEPEASVAAAPAVRSSIDTHNKRFEPSTLVVPVGSTVSFPNRDVVLHNAFSVTPSSAFDLGIYGGGEQREHVFTRTGIVRVHCNVHHSMQADIVVVDTPFFSKADSQGRFAFSGVPAGRGTLVLWHPRANLQSQAVSIPVTGPMVLTMVASKPSIEPHTRKDGGSYRDELRR